MNAHAYTHTSFIHAQATNPVDTLRTQWSQLQIQGAAYTNSYHSLQCVAIKATDLVNVESVGGVPCVFNILPPRAWQRCLQEPRMCVCMHFTRELGDIFVCLYLCVCEYEILYYARILYIYIYACV